MKASVTIWSEGTRLAADLFVPDELAQGERRAAIVLCHGWAGPKSHLSNTYAPHFCAAGFVCVTFDYRGWYESDARLVTLEAQPAVEEDGTVTMRAKPVREVVDPLDQNRDIHNVLAWLYEHEAVDPARVGLWGSSYGGGHVIHVGGTDPRIKAIVSQVPGMGQAPDDAGFSHPPDQSQAIAAQMARGEVDVVPRPPGTPDSLKGAADSRSMWRYLPRVQARNICAPTLIIDQEQEEYGGRENSGLAAKENIPAQTIVDYQVLPGTHYDIYSTNFETSAKLATDWFKRYL